jgi:hypothetical protein
MCSFTQDLLSAVFDTVHDNGGPTLLGQRLGIRPTVLSNKANPKQRLNQLSLIEALKLQAITGDHRILKAMARALGYVIVPVDEPQPSDVELLTLYAKWQDSHGKIHHAIARAFEDRRITRAEQVEIERRWHDAACAGATYIHRMGGLVQ